MCEKGGRSWIWFSLRRYGRRDAVWKVRWEDAGRGVKGRVFAWKEAADRFAIKRLNTEAGAWKGIRAR